MSTVGGLARPQILPHLAHDTSCTLFDCKWVPCSTRFVVTGTKPTGEGILKVFSMGVKEIETLGEADRPMPIKCATFRHSSLEQRHLATGDFSGTLCTWDLERLDGPVTATKGHEDFINAIDGFGGVGAVDKGAPEIATASRDGTVKVWDPRIKDRPVACVQPMEGEQRRDAWAVAFGNCHGVKDRMLASGYDNGDIKMFDLRAMKLFWETRVPNGVCSLQFDRADIEMNKLTATCLEGRMHLWDLRTMHPEKGFAMLDQRMEATSATVWCGRHLPQDRDIFMAAGGSGDLSLWKYEYPDKRFTTNEKTGEKEGVVGKWLKQQESQLGDQPISSFDWSADKAGLGVCVSFDQTVKIVIVTKLNTL